MFTTKSLLISEDCLWLHVLLELHEISKEMMHLITGSFHALLSCKTWIRMFTCFLCKDPDVCMALLMLTVWKKEKLLLLFWKAPQWSLNPGFWNRLSHTIIFIRHHLLHAYCAISCVYSLWQNQRLSMVEPLKLNPKRIQIQF